MSQKADPTRYGPRYYGRRVGKRLSQKALAALSQDLPPRRIDLDAKGMNIHPDALFSRRYDRYALEIGFGDGEQTIYAALHQPETGFLVADAYWNGIAALARACTAAAIENIRIYPDDCRPLLPCLAEGSLAGIYILFPDPWPKRRHHDRRLVNVETVRQCARLLCSGGHLYLASDHQGYLERILTVLHRCPDFEWQAKHRADWLQPPYPAIKTKYQRKAEREGRTAVFLSYRRR